jgi:hypothetical protein
LLRIEALRCIEIDDAQYGVAASYDLEGRGAVGRSYHPAWAPFRVLDLDISRVGEASCPDHRPLAVLIDED